MEPSPPLSLFQAYKGLGGGQLGGDLDMFREEVERKFFKKEKDKAWRVMERREGCQWEKKEISPQQLLFGGVEVSPFASLFQPPGAWIGVDEERRLIYGSCVWTFIALKETREEKGLKSPLLY